MSLLPKSIHWCRRYPTKFNSGRDIPRQDVPYRPRDRTRVLGGVKGKARCARRLRRP